jgi:EmrB/QacA subfamily drug resistance transporter
MALREEHEPEGPGGPGEPGGAPPSVAAPSAAPAPIVDPAAIRPIIIGILLAMFLSALEQTIVAPALPTIGRALGGAENLSWVVTAYLLSATAVTPLFGKLSDIYGRRTIMRATVILFVVGSVACALAPNMETLILARALQGLGGGGILPIAQTIVADILSPRERPRYQSYSAVMFMGASALGPLLGGVLTDWLHWSSIFWINLPLGVVALVASDRALRLLPRHDRPHRLDLLGALVMVAAALALMLAMTWAGVRYAWTSPQILALIGGSAILWALFALRLVSAREPFIPLAMLADPLVAALTAAGFFSIGAAVGLSIVSPLYLDLVLGLSASGSGTALIFFMIGTVVGAVVTGRSLARLVRYKFVPVVGLLVGIAALACLAFDPAAYSVVGASALFFVCGAGVGTMYPVTTVLIQNAVPLHQLGTATGMLNFFRLLGGAIIVALFGAIVLGAVDARGGMAALDSLQGRAGADFSAAFRWVFVAAAFCLAIALAFVLPVEERPLRGPGPRAR